MTYPARLIALSMMHVQQARSVSMHMPYAQTDSPDSEEVVEVLFIERADVPGNCPVMTWRTSCTSA